MTSEAVSALTSIRIQWESREGKESFRLTEAEWEAIEDILIENDFVYYLKQHPYGFYFEVYQDVPWRSDPVLRLRCADFPGPPDQRSLLRKLSVFTHSPKNKEALSRCGRFAPLKDLSYYAYC